MIENFEKVPEGKGIVTLSVDEMLHLIESSENGNLEGLIETGFKNLDELILGYFRGELIIYGSRPGMGVTSFLLNQAISIGHFNKVPVAFFSIQLSKNLLVERLVSILARKKFALGSKNGTGELSNKETTQLLSELKSSPLYFMDAPKCYINELIEQITILVKENKVKLVFIDYLQIIKMSGKKGISRDEELGRITLQLKETAKELDIAIIVSSTLNRSVETRGGDKRPYLSDLRECGSIEQIADKVMFIYRPEVYQITENEKGESLQGMAEIIVAKNNRGPLDSIPLHFIKSIGVFNTPIELDGFNFSEFKYDLPKDPF